MYTLIPEQTAKYLKREYRIRVIILVALFMSLGVWIGIISLFPSYVVSITQEKKALDLAGTVEQTAQSASTSAATRQISAGNLAITTLQKNQDILMISSIIEDIASRRVPGITINDFEVGRSGTQETNIVIQGKAATRNELDSFKNNLETDSRFSKVDLPVEYLAADTNISFSINLTGIE